MVYASVNVHGQITLPHFLRSRHGIDAGSTVTIEERGDELVIAKAAVVNERLLRELAALAKEKGVTKSEVVRAVRKIGRELYAEEVKG